MKNPKGHLVIQVLAMPKDTNTAGDVFGGWLLSQMDIAGGVFCQKLAKGRVVTVAIETITFNEPMFVGDTLSCFVELIKIGRTSMKVKVEAWVSPQYETEFQKKVTEGTFVFVKVDQNRKPLPIEGVS